MGLVFFGNERLANSVNESGVILSSLLDAGHEIHHLVINRAERRSRKKHEDAVVKIAHANGINVIDLWDEDRVIELAKESEAGVLASFGHILKDEVIGAFDKGIINVHPSLLPEFRGPTPIESAILGNSSKTGVSIMALASVMDGGDVYARADYNMRGDETKQELYDILSERGAQLLVEQLPSILDGSNKGEPQNHDEATFTKLIIKSDGEIDWDLPAEVLERQVRAFAGWPSSRALLAGHEITITKSHVSERDGKAGGYEVIDKEIVIGCGEGSLVIEELKPAGRANMSAEAFLAGNKI